MQYFDEIAQSFGASRGGAKEFVAFLRVLFEAQDDVAEISESDGAFEIRQQSWKLMADVGDYHPACARVLRGPVRRPRGRLRPPYSGAFEASAGR